MNLNSLSDEELMVLYQNGAEKAFSILYERYSARIYSFIRKKNPAVVEDIYQEVFLKIHKSKHLYNKTLPVAPWIFTIARNIIIDETRKSSGEKNRAEIDFEKIIAQEQTVTGLSELNPSLGKLSPQQRAAIEMRYIDDKTFEQIAEQLKTSPLNVRKIVSRGIKKIKTLFNEGSNNE